MPSLRCPICGENCTRENPAFPFCSPRCRKIDLSRWLNEEYSFTDDPEEDPESHEERYDDEDDDWA